MKTKPAPFLNPATHEPLRAEEMNGIFCEALVRQELDNDTAYVEIPEEIQTYYKMFRPSPLMRAYHLEKKLDTPQRYIINLKVTIPAAVTS